MSHEDRLADIREQADEYIAMGVATVWIVDPRRRTAYVADRTGLNSAMDVLSAAGSPIVVPLAQVFAYLDKMEARK